MCRDTEGLEKKTEIESSRAADWGWSAKVRFYVSLEGVLYTIPLLTMRVLLCEISQVLQPTRCMEATPKIE
jgi:hypothetical protein